MVFNLKEVYYHNLQLRNQQKRALMYLYDCKHINSVLKTKQEAEESIKMLKNLKLKPHNSWPKNWGCYRAFSFILKHGNKESKVLDVGCADYGVILPWLELYGLSNLYGCDILFEKKTSKKEEFVIISKIYKKLISHKTSLILSHRFL